LDPPVTSTIIPRRIPWASGGPGLRLRKTGETEDGRDVIGGCFRFIDERGVPIEVLISIINDRGGVVDWLDFWSSAMKQGWKPDRTFIKLRRAVTDIYGEEWAEEWERRLRASAYK